MQHPVATVLGVGVELRDLTGTRVRAAGPGSAAGPLVVGDLKVDLTAYSASVRGALLPLRPSQVELLAVLIANRNRVTSREELSERIGVRNARSIDVLLSSLRRILGEDFVRTVRSRGWILRAGAFEP